MIVPRVGTHSGGEAPYRSRRCDECLAPTSHLPLINWGCNSPLLYHIASYLLSARIAPWNAEELRHGLDIVEEGVALVDDALFPTSATQPAEVLARKQVSGRDLHASWTEIDGVNP